MSNNETSSSCNVYDSIVCEAIGCSSNATNTIKLKIGSDRTVSLFLCSNCKAKLHFESSEKDISTLTSCGKKMSNL
jgi:hypothetical protein